MSALLTAAVLAAVPAAAQGILGSDAAACTRRTGPAIQVAITGLKDRTGELKLELYPANDADFLRKGRELRAAGKIFRRITVKTPPRGATVMCIRVPRPGRYAVVFTHNRDGRNKFNVWSDGAGLPSSRRLRRAWPTVEQAIVTVPDGVAMTSIRTQYLRGISGFGPVKRG